VRTIIVSSIAILAAFTVSCPGSGGDAPAAQHKDGSAAADRAPVSTAWQLFDVPSCAPLASDQTGYQTVAAASGGKVAFATLTQTVDQAPCAIEGRPGATASVTGLCLVLPSASGFDGTIAASLPYAAMMGVGLAFDKAGEPWLAYTGGPSAAQRCGASDMMLASVSGGKLGTPITIATGSQSSGMPADQTIACAAQNVCNQGDATGYWPAAALDPVSGTLAVAFRDLHFGFADTDFNSSDVEFARGDAFPVFTADVARGGGTYIRLGFSPAGKAAIVHYNTYQPAIWIDHELAQTWESQKLFVGTIREQIGFAVSRQGLHALAYCEDARSVLSYRESSDGSTWTTTEDIDRDGLTGYTPSLAFDDNGEPAIAYYRCNDYGADAGCDPEKDGLYLIRRRGGVWGAPQKISSQSGISDGQYPALAFADGKAVIAFQSSYYDFVAGSSKTMLSVAKEP